MFVVLLKFLDVFLSPDLVIVALQQRLVLSGQARVETFQIRTTEKVIVVKKFGVKTENLIFQSLEYSRYIMENF